MKKTAHDGPCDPGRLLDLVAGRLPEAEADGLRRHVAGCPECGAGIEAARALGRGIQAMTQAALSPSVAEEVRAGLASEVREAARRTRQRRAWATVLTSRAAGLAAVLLVVAAGALVLVLARGREVAGEGEVLRDGQGALLECGARVELAGDTEVRVIGSGAERGEIRLVHGSVEVSVEKLPSGTFRVVTEDAIVRVTGTRFVVSRTDGESTHVLVREGTVEVGPLGGGRPAEVLERGESIRVPGIKAYAAGLRREGIDALGRGDLEAAVAALTAYLAALGKEHDVEAEMLLAGALVEKGDSEAAIAAYRLVADADDSLRAENALAFLAILYQRIGDGESSAAAWREYIRRFPDGVHGKDALRELEQIE